MCVCVLAFSYLASKQRLFCAVLYCHLWPARLYCIFLYYLIKDTIFGRKGY